MDPTQARHTWHLLETVNAVTYFSPECREAPAALGLEGFWMGYFACRAAPMGPVPAGVVDATFFNFHPRRVRRAIPEAWTRADPADVVQVRADAAARALRRLLPGGEADRLAADVVPSLRAAIDAANPAGRPLFAANRDLPAPTDPVAALWQAATTLREHRGDTHVALLTAAGLDGCEVHVLFAASEGVDGELYQQSRGWSPEDWGAATERLVARGTLDTGGAPTTAGRDLRQHIERRTDELSAEPYAAVERTEVDALVRALTPAATRIAGAGDIRYPNPMGLPRPTTA